MSKSKVSLAPSDISNKWGTNMKASVPFIQKGIDAVTDSPMEKAAASQDKYLMKVQEAVSSGKFAGALRKVSLGDWKAVTKMKVAARLSSGVDAAATKRAQFDQWLVGRLNGILPQIAGMPSMTIDDSIARVGTLIRYMHEQPYKTS